jgi:SAM-dependent methyltransferase
MDWYQKAFGEDYVKVYAHRNVEEAKRLVNFIYDALPLKPGQKVLDLGSGYGRNAIEIAKKQLDVYCLDLSPVLIKMARELSIEKQIDMNFMRADMRYLPLKQNFDVVVSLFTSFGYFENELENINVLKNVKNVLKPNGKFLLDYLNVKHTLLNLVPRDQQERDGFTVIQKRHFDDSTERIKKRIIINGKAGERVYNESVRAYGVAEMATMFAEVGLKCLATFGDYSGKPYSPDSPRLIMIGQKV